MRIIHVEKSFANQHLAQKLYFKLKLKLKICIYLRKLFPLKKELTH